MPVAPPPLVLTTEDVSRHCKMSSWGKNYIRISDSKNFFQLSTPISKNVAAPHLDEYLFINDTQIDSVDYFIIHLLHKDIL